MSEKEKIPREMVLFPNESQFNEKSNELYFEQYDEIDGEEEDDLEKEGWSTECWWSIPMYPSKKEELIDTKIYFYDKVMNHIAMVATITGFDYNDDGKKTVLFRKSPEDRHYAVGEINFEGKYEKRTQTRGWCYRWWM